MEKVLELHNLTVDFNTTKGKIEAIQGIDLEVNAGQILCVVGESGCGKTTLCKSIMHLLPTNAQIKTGSIAVCGQNITKCKETQMQKLRGNTMSMVFQDPLSALDPMICVGKQITDAILKHQKVSKAQAKVQTLELLKLVGIKNAEQRFDLQPHLLSGGMRQRCVIAAALAPKPKLLLADEVTTALDATTKRKILNLFADIQKKTGIAIVFITHDISSAACIADHIAIMNAGKIVEINTPKNILYHPCHPYTKTLVSLLPRLLPSRTTEARARAESRAKAGTGAETSYCRTPHHNKKSNEETARNSKLSEENGEHPAQIVSNKKQNNSVLELRNIELTFHVNNHFEVKALDSVSLSIKKGEIFGLVGETGCGKSSLARIIAGIYQPNKGEIFFDGDQVLKCTDNQKMNDSKSAAHSKRLKRHSARKKQVQGNIQLIFQDSSASLNPKMTIEEIITEPYRILKRKNLQSSFRSKFQTKSQDDLQEKLCALISSVGLPLDILNRRPDELSGGQCQRVAIARSLITDPQLIIADEPITSLDVFMQMQIVTLFQKLQQERNFSLLFIAHDLSLMRLICNRIAVMFNGKIVEVAQPDELFLHPVHPYTKTLLNAIPSINLTEEDKDKIISYND